MRRELLVLLIGLVGCSRGTLDVIELVPPSDGAPSVYEAGPIQRDSGAGPGIDANLDANLDATSDAPNGIDTGIDGGQVLTLEDLQRAYIDLRFGMLIHFGILTYTGSWGDARLPIEQFNPTKLDTNQWANAAVAAKMKYAIMSVRHIDGFALWPTATTDFDVASIGWRKGGGDVVRDFVEAFRYRGLKVGFMYSMWDATQEIGNSGVGNTTITRSQIDFLEAQLTELLSNYGTISYLLFTGWAWQMGHNAVPYQEIRELVKSLQPTCLVFDQTQLMNLWDADAALYDETWGITSPADNTLPSTQIQKINGGGGNDWFWSPTIGILMNPTDIVQNHLQPLEARWTNFLLNCPPNRDGLLDLPIVDTLTQVGALWNPDPSRKPLPAQGLQNEHPYTPVGAYATSGTASAAIDGVNTYNTYSVWQSSGSLPQSVTLDLGVARPDVGILQYVPRYSGRETAETDGAITSYAILTATNRNNFTMATTGTWPSNSAMKTATFSPVNARYVRLEARAVTGANAAATEITVGARR
jgi:alpha-L-fucosidase